MPGFMKVNGAFKAGTIVAEVGFVHALPVRGWKCLTDNFQKVNKCNSSIRVVDFTRTDEYFCLLGVLSMTATHKNNQSGKRA